MLAIGRALMARPRLLLLDEPSMGLAPKLIQQIFSIIGEINEQGTTVLLVEQNAAQALKRADTAHILETGEIVRSGTGAELAGDDCGQGGLPRRRRLDRLPLGAAGGLQNFGSCRAIWRRVRVVSRREHVRCSRA